MSKIIIPAGAKEDVVIENSLSLEDPRLIPRKYQANRFAMIKAEKG